jgi:protein gp37
MGDRSPIEWTDSTWNPTTGCTKVSQGCKHCYAERLFPRAYANAWIPDGKGGMRIRRIRNFTDVLCHPERLDQPLHWKKPRRVFVNSMSDLFHEDVPDEFILEVFDVMRQCENGYSEKLGRLASQHTFQILTKRADRMRDFCTRLRFAQNDDRGMYLAKSLPHNGFNPMRSLRHVWLGVSAEDQPTADERIPLLLQTPAAVRFVSYEPALGPVDFTRIRTARSQIDALACDYLGMGGEVLAGPPSGMGPIDWIIAGGESGPNARPAHPDWFRSARDQCVAAGVAFFFKQWGEWAPDCRCQIVKPHKTTERPSPGRGVMFRCGKKPAGRTLDGHEHSEYPA